MRVHRARASYRPEARFSTWLFRIGTHLALERAAAAAPARATRECRCGAGAGARWRPSEPVDELVDARRVSAEVEAARAALPERQRAALWLAAVEGLSYAEVAAALDTSEKAVKALVHRARAALAEALAAHRWRCGRRGARGGAMSCAEFAADLSARIDGELPAARAAAVEAHVAACAACRAQVEALRRADGELRAIPLREMPSGALAEVLRRAARARTAGRAPASARPPVALGRGACGRRRGARALSRERGPIRSTPRRPRISRWRSISTRSKTSR